MGTGTHALFQPFPMLSGRRAQTWRHQPSFRRPRHFHAEPELNFVFRGAATLGVGAQRLSLTGGDVVLLHPGQDHELLDASSDLELHVVALRPSLVERLRAFPVGPASARVRLDASQRRSLEERLTAMAGVNDAMAVERELALAFSTIAADFTGAHVLSRRALQVLRVERAWSEEQIADRLDANPSQVSRHFHRDLGVKLCEYRARLRLMEFIQLVDSGQALSHAALSADFGSYAQCHRVFRRLVRCAPKDYFAGARREVDAAVLPERRRGTS